MGYAAQITVNHSLEKINFVAIGKAFTWESFPQNSGLEGDGQRVETTSHQCNMQKMMTIGQKVRGILNHESQKWLN